MSHSAHYSIAEALEKLLGLLSGKQADTLGALAQVEQMLEQDICAKEVQIAGAAAAAIIEQLILPALSQDPSRMEQAKNLQAYFLQETSEQAADRSHEDAPSTRDHFLENSLQSLSEGMPVYVAPRTEDALPQTLSARLAAALHLVGESEVAMRERITGWQNDDRIEWAAVGQFLEEIQTAGHKAAAAPWQRQRRTVYDTVLRIAQGNEETLTYLGRKEAKLVQLFDAARQFALIGNKAQSGVRRFHALLHAQGMEMQKEGRTLRAQQDEGRQRAEQFKLRVDQLEASLAQVRREQFLDPSTGVPDRFAFTAHLHRHLDRALHLGETFSLLLFHFYELQTALDRLDQNGGPLHAEQRLLMAMIQEMRPHLPETAFVARLSTERMVILLPKYSVQETEQMGTVIGQGLEEVSFALDDEEILVQANFGCAAFQPGMDMAQLLETTDRLAAAAHNWRAEGQTTARRTRAC